MLKQLFGKLPRKSSKSDLSESPRTRATDSHHSSSRTSSAQTGHGVHGQSGGSSASARSNTPKKASAAVFPASVVAGIEPLVPFKDVPSSEKMNLFISKLSLCGVTFDFSDPGKNSVEKDVKRQTLLELVEFIGSGTLRFGEPAIHAMCKMCAINLFRIFPPNYRSINGVGGGENEDDEPTFDPVWPHLQIVYDLLLNFIHSSYLDAKLAKKYIDHSFILKLLDLFDSEDPRERECLKTVLHRIYGKFMVHRPFIRKSINNIFFRFVFETERHNGIAELLELFGSIISGFALPLKEEHKIFLWRILIPLHKPKCVSAYFQQLSYCILQFIEKDPKLANVVIKGILRYWPITNSQKEVMFLGELEEILEAITMAEFQKVAVPIFAQIGHCINSFHFQVAERALFLWNNDRILGLMAQNRHVILPVVLPALEKNAQSHWNQAVLNLSLNVRKMFVEMDDELFAACLVRLNEQESNRSSVAEKRKREWERLESAANLQPIAERTAVLAPSIPALF